MVSNPVGFGEIHDEFEIDGRAEDMLNFSETFITFLILGLKFHYFFSTGAEFSLPL